MKLLNDIKQLAVSAAAALKNAARRVWQTTTALLRRLRTPTGGRPNGRPSSPSLLLTRW